MALIGYLRKSKWRSDSFEHWLVLSLIVNFVTQAAFMSSSTRLYDANFDAAHLLKMGAYICVLIGLLANMYRLFWLSASEPVMVYAPIRKSIVDVNQAMAHLFGYAQEEMLRLHPEALASDAAPYTRQGLMARFEKAAIGERQVFEWQCRAKDRSLLWVEIDLQRSVFGSRDSLLLRARDITDRRNAGKALKEERDFSAALIASLPGFFILLDEHGRLVRWNDALPALVGVAGDKLRGADAFSFVVESDRYRAQAKMQEGFSLGFADIDVGVQTKNGDVRTIRLSGRTITNEGNSYVVGIGNDITETQEAQKRLRTSEERFRAIFDSINDGIFISDPGTGRFVEVNRRGCDMYGYSHDEIVGGDIEQLSSGVPPYTQSDALEWLGKARSSGPQTFEWRGKAKDKRLFWVEISLRYAVFGTRDVLLATIRDISERKRAEERIRLQVEQYRTMLATTADGFWILDATGKFLDANEAWCRMTGYTRAELLNLQVRDIDASETSEAASRRLATVRNQGFERFETRRRRKDGSHFEVEVSASFWGGMDQFLCFGRDITERKRDERALIESELRLSTVLDTAVEGIVMVDAETRKFSFANRAFCNLLGYRSDEILALGLEDIHPPEELPHIGAAFERNLRGEIRGISNLPTKRKNGSVFFADLSGSPVTLRGRTCIVGCFHDVTERKIAADALAYRDRILHAVTVATAELIAGEPIGTGMSNALKTIGEALVVDRVLVLENTPDVRVPPALYGSWQAAGIAVPIDQAMISTGAPEAPEALGVWLAPLAEGKPVVSHARTAEAPIRRLLENLQNKSMLLMPILAGGRLWGTVGIDECGSEREWTTTEIDVLGTFAEIIGIVIQRQGTQLSLRKSEERFRAVSETALDAIIIIDPEARVCYWNRAAERTLGYSADEAMGKTIHHWLVPQRLREQAVKGFSVFAATGQGPVLGKTVELAARRKDGVEVPIELAINMMMVGPERYAVGILRDISERKLAEEKMIHMARRDSLTGLANRLVFVERLDQEIVRAARQGARSFAVLYLDLDHFKDVNDTLGHPVGDLLLAAVAARLRASIRETDPAARFGGDEFAVVVTDIRDPLEVAAVADKIVKALSEPFTIQGNEIRCGMSVGIAVYGLDSTDAETLLSHADVALYRAKSERRGTYRFFTDAMDTEVRARVTMGTELREAIDSKQLFLVYQPQVDVDTGASSDSKRWCAGGIRSSAFWVRATSSRRRRETA